jgi:hypothetical protein
MKRLSLRPSHPLPRAPSLRFQSLSAQEAERELALRAAGGGLSGLAAYYLHNDDSQQTQQLLPDPAGSEDGANAAGDGRADADAGAGAGADETDAEMARAEPSAAAPSEADADLDDGVDAQPPTPPTEPARAPPPPALPLTPAAVAAAESAAWTDDDASPRVVRLAKRPHAADAAAADDTEPARVAKRRAPCAREPAATAAEAAPTPCAALDSPAARLERLVSALAEFAALPDDALRCLSGAQQQQAATHASQLAPRLFAAAFGRGGTH